MPPTFIETINPFPVVASKCETKFVHITVGDKEDPLPATHRMDGQDIVQCVHFDFFHVWYDLPHDDPDYLCFITRHGDDNAETFHELELCISEWRHVIIPTRWFQHNFLREKQ